MKKFITLLIFSAVMIISLQAQNVANYTCKLDNGITVRMEQCWNHVWVTQSYESLKPGDPAISVDIRPLGDLTQSSAFQLITSGKEVKVQGAKPGTYSLKMIFKLSGKPGTISFDIENVTIKPDMKTKVSVTIYDYQIQITETAGSQQGVSAFTTRVERYKGNPETNPACGTPAFYEKGKHDTPLNPVELKNKSGKIKAGTYDLVLTLGGMTRPQKIWLENFNMKPDVSYSITANLNAGVVEYAGASRDVKAIQMYPAGTADRLKGSTTAEKNLEIIRCEGMGVSVPCPPGTYDALITGTKSEWRKGIVVKTSGKSQIK